MSLDPARDRITVKLFKADRLDDLLKDHDRKSPKSTGDGLNKTELFFLVIITLGIVLFLFYSIYPVSQFFKSLI